MKFIDVTIKARLTMADDAPYGVSEDIGNVSWAEAIRLGLGSDRMAALQITGVIPGKRKLEYSEAEDERALKDKKLGAKSLRESKCDECDEPAFTRWYSGKGRHERIEMTLCKTHNDEMLAERRTSQPSSEPVNAGSYEVVALFAGAAPYNPEHETPEAPELPTRER